MQNYQSSNVDFYFKAAEMLPNVFAINPENWQQQKFNSVT
jgi:hypothetical protein